MQFTLLMLTLTCSMNSSSQPHADPMQLCDSLMKMVLPRGWASDAAASWLRFAACGQGVWKRRSLPLMFLGGTSALVNLLES